MRRVLVIIPAWNEQGSVAETVHEVRRTNPGVDVLVVDDGSTDATAERALSAGAMVCSLPFNLGVGGAMRAGFRYALRHGYDAAAQIDADGQHDPAFRGCSPGWTDRMRPTWSSARGSPRPRTPTGPRGSAGSRWPCLPARSRRWPAPG